MSEKSHISREQRLCLVCGELYDTGNMLRLLNSMEMKCVVTGNGLCPEHERLRLEGYIALIEVDPTKSHLHGNFIKPEEAYRTGRICHIKQTAANTIFDKEIKGPMLYVEPGFIDNLELLAKSDNHEN